ncbi:MAG: LysM peptidoglycan-binding domain-containing protein [Eubacteriales bacterium]
MIIYTVKNGDSVYSIARRYDTTPSRIIIDNNLENPGKLSVGQTLVLLYPTQTHTVRGGDTLNGIAQEYGVTLNELWQNNPQLAGGMYIYPGQTLNISYEAPPLGGIRTDGYAYPYIDREVLRTTLPYLTYLSIFSYGMKPDGTLIPPTGGDDELISIAREYGTVPLMILTSLTEQGTFSNELVTQVLSDEALADRVIENTLRTVREKNYGGVNVDFEYIPAESADAYLAFLDRLHSALAQEGYILLSSLAPKTSATQQGLLYEGHNYPAIGAIADLVLLMTYEWGYTYGEPMAVSPLPEMQRVIDYAVSEIPRDKILLGMPNYAYNWALPYVRGKSRAQPLSNTEAVQLASEKHAEIQFDERSQTPYFNYYEPSPEGGKPVEHVVWFDDARSMDAKLRLIQENGLTGTGIWNIMRYFPQLWLVLNALYTIEKL